MTDSPTVSVIVPVFNSATTIKAAIESILNQTYPANEIIVINNNSTDNLYEVLQTFTNKIILHNCEIQGVSNARNMGAKLASSEYIAFLDADDYWFPEKLRMQTKAILESQSGYSIIGSYADFYISGKKIGGSIRSKNDTSALANFKQFGELPCITSSWIVSRKGYLDLGGMDPEISTAQDFEFVCRAVANGFDFKIMRISLVAYAISVGSITHMKYLEQYYRAHFYQKFYFSQSTNQNFEDFSSSIRLLSSTWRKARSSKFIRVAMIYFSQKKLLRSLVLINLAAILSPLSTLKKAKRQIHWK